MYTLVWCKCAEAGYGAVWRGASLNGAEALGVDYCDVKESRAEWNTVQEERV